MKRKKTKKKKKKRKRKRKMKTPKTIKTTKKIVGKRETNWNPRDIGQVFEVRQVV